VIITLHNYFLQLPNYITRPGSFVWGSQKYYLIVK